MRVFEVAQEFDVSAETLVHLLREMGIPVRSHMTALGEEHVAKLRTRLERERRLGHTTAEKAIGAALEDAQTTPRRPRRG
jgi:translation initiation factor IF-2